jgi:hypothetical protein
MRGLTGRAAAGAGGPRSLTAYTPRQPGRTVPAGCAGAATASHATTLGDRVVAAAVRGLRVPYLVTALLTGLALAPVP